MQGKLGFSATISALALIPAIAFGCDYGTPLDADDLTDDVWKAISKAAYASREELLAAPGDLRFTSFDLNNDGNAEICAAVETTLTCSNGNAVCLHLVVQSGTPVTNLYEYASHGLSLAEGETGGWRNLASKTQTVDGEVITFVTYGQHGYSWSE